MNIIKLNALKLYLEKLERHYTNELSTNDFLVYQYYHEKLIEVRKHLKQVKNALQSMLDLQVNCKFLTKCLNQDSSLAHPIKEESNL